MGINIFFYQTVHLCFQTGVIKIRFCIENFRQSGLKIIGEYAAAYFQRSVRSIVIDLDRTDMKRMFVNEPAKEDDR
jgi:hypothetical protein